MIGLSKRVLNKNPTKKATFSTTIILSNPSGFQSITATVETIQRDRKRASGKSKVSLSLSLSLCRFSSSFNFISSNEAELVSYLIVCSIVCFKEAFGKLQTGTTSQSD